MMLPIFRSMAFSSCSLFDLMTYRGSEMTSIRLLILSVGSGEGQTLATHAVNCPSFGISQARRTLTCSSFFAKFVAHPCAILHELGDRFGTSRLLLQHCIRCSPATPSTLLGSPSCMSRCSFPQLLKSPCCCDFRFPKRYAFLLCPPKMNPINSVLRVFPT